MRTNDHRNMVANFRIRKKQPDYNFTNNLPSSIIIAEFFPEIFVTGKNQFEGIFPGRGEIDFFHDPAFLIGFHFKNQFILLIFRKSMTRDPDP